MVNNSKRFWPDRLEMGDTLTFEGDEYVVIGTGPGEATLERADNEFIQMELSRWALTHNVAVEIKTDIEQEPFGELVD